MCLERQDVGWLSALRLEISVAVVPDISRDPAVSTLQAGTHVSLLSYFYMSVSDGLFSRGTYLDRWKLNCYLSRSR